MTFQWPFMLFSLALIPILIALYFLAQRRRKRYAVRFTNLTLLQDVAGPGPGVRRHIPPGLYLLGALMMLTGLARPEALVKAPQEQSAVVIAIDVSASMTANDMEPSRLEAAKKAATAFVDGLPDQVQVGLVGFSQTAGVIVPLTRDHKMVKVGIDLLVADGGTAIGEAIYQSLDQLALREALEKGQTSPATIVLLSDGQSNVGRPPVDAAQSAQTNKVAIYTIGIGQRGAQTAIATGQTVGLDEEALQTIAKITGGKYYYAAETEKLTQIYKEISSRIAWVEQRTEITAFIDGLGTILFIIGGLLSLRWFQQIP